MTPSDDRDPVDLLAEEFADRLRRGEHPSVGDYAAAHPDHADQLREVLPAVAQMEFLKRFRRATSLAEKAALPDRFGDFRIVREVGRGGMGVVFEAVQESLGRPVALKVLSTHAQLDPTRRERFVREAHAAARLHHTNIVPVFGVGEQDGLPYYVMQLIRGEGLNAVAHRWRKQKGQAGAVTKLNAGDTKPGDSGAAFEVIEPDAEHPGPDHGDWAFVAEVGVQAADALHYAHRQGVLHRDVKPANLILDPERRVWVTDFGLAKVTDLAGLTASGDILGTLQYLPPESLHGDADPRSDVYGLGATLYELLTLQPPYAAESPAQLLKLVADTDPAAPRELNPDVPRDLETIVLKAMARSPGDRYASAREMAADLQAFLDDRPIKARRQTAIARAWRWCRRNPATSILSANLAAALVLAGVVGWVGYAKATKALEAEQAQLEAANRARADAVAASKKLEENLRMSLEAFEGVFDAAVKAQGFGGRGGPGGPPPFGGGFGALPVPEGKGGFDGKKPGGFGGPGGPVTPDEDKAALLEAILAFYDRFAERNATAASPRLLFDVARAHRRVGEVHAMRANFTGTANSAEKAAAAFRRAAGLLEKLAAAEDADDKVRAELAQTYLSTPPDVFSDYENLLVRARDLATAGGDGPRQYLPGTVTLKLGWVRDRRGDRAGAETAYREAVDLLAAPDDGQDPRVAPIVVEQATARSQLAAILAATNRLPEARIVLTDSAAELRRLVERSSRGPGGHGGPGGPGGRPPWETIAQTHHQLADVCERLGDRAAADAARAEANRAANQSGFGGKDGFGGKKGPPDGGGGKKDFPPRPGE